jgi:ABC-type amino acid transport substrate-binding protein
MVNMLIKLRLSFLAVLFLIIGSGLIAEDFPQIRKQGELTAGARPISTLIYSPENKTMPGFCYELASKFAESLDVELKVVPVESFREYWKRNEAGDELALMNEVDIYAEILTVTPEREKILHMTPFIENSEVLVGNADSRARTFEDLLGKRISVVKGMSFQNVLEKALNAHDIPFVSVPAVLENGTIVPAPGHEVKDSEDAVTLLLLPPDTRTTIMFFPEQLSKDAIDFFILDSFSFFHQFNISQTLRQSVRPVFPINDEIGELAFGVSKEATALAAALDRWMSSFKQSPEYAALLKRYIGLISQQYMEFLRELP